MNDFIKEFNEKTGAQAEQVTGQNDDKLLAQVAGGTPPDLFFMSTNAPFFIVNGLAEPLDNWLKRDRMDIADWFEKCLQQYRLGGKLYGLAYDFGNNVIYSNMELFRRHGLRPLPTDWRTSGWTYQDFLEMARRLTAGEGESKVWGYGVSAGQRQWANWMLCNGGSYLTPDLSKFNMTAPQTVDGLQFLADLINRYRVSPTLAEAGAQGGLFNLFAAGKLALYTNIPAQVVAHRKLTFEWDVAVRPVGRGPRSTAGGGTAWAFMKAGKQKEAAWELYKFVTSKDVQLRHMKLGLKAPGRKSVINDPFYVNDTPPKSMIVFREAPNYVIPEPQMVNWPQFYKEIDTQLRDLLNGKITARAAVENMARAVEPLVAENAQALKRFAG